MKTDTLGTSRTVLFVDDEVRVLQGIRRMLCSKGSDWNMLFVTRAAEALDVLARQPVHVVVSDMRMPGMDGKELLDIVMQKYPEVVRIILSGQPDRDILLKSAGLAHQFLSKPCDADVLKSGIERIMGLRSVLRNKAVRKLVSEIDVLPSLPATYQMLTEVLLSPSGSIERVGDIVSRDMGMTAKILQLVNSSYFGLRSHVSDPHHAASLLGVETIKAMVLSIHIFKQFDQAPYANAVLPKLWSHCIDVSAFAQLIGRAEGMNEHRVNDVLMAGLLHDIGKLVLLAHYKDAYYDMIVKEREDAMRLCEMEAGAFGAAHPEIGAYLVGLWGMNYPIVEALAYHHVPHQGVEEGFDLVTVVHVANSIEHELSQSDKAVQPVDRTHLERIGKSERFDQWRHLCRNLIEKRTT